MLDAHHTTPGSIRRTDNLRGFFDKPFSNLLKRVFGYGDFEASWLNIVTKGRDADARALVDLLAPDGKLFAAMAQADSDDLVQYIFPTERLPAHTQELLKEPQGYGLRLLDAWPQYRGRIRADPAGRPQVYLNLFEYFMFWTAFYVLRGSASDNSRSDPRAPPGSASSSMMYGMSGIRSVGSAIVGNLILGRPAGGLQSHPYYCLLKTYLEYFLPRSGGGVNGTGAEGAAGVSRAAQAASAAAAAGTMGGGMGYGLGLSNGAAAGGAVGWASYKPTLTAAAAGPESRSAVLLSILVEFWLTDLAEPLPSPNTDRASCVVLPSGVVGSIGGLGVGSGLGAAIGSPAGAVGLAGSASPVPVPVSAPPNVRMLTYQPPSEELVEGLVALVRYVHVVEQDPTQPWAGPSGTGGRSPVAIGMSPSSAAASAAAAVRSSVGNVGRRASGGGNGCGFGGIPQRPPQFQLQPAQVGRAPWLPETPVKTPPPPPPRLLMPPTALLVQGNSATPAVQAVSRKVYRQLRRAFSQWPPGSPNSLTPLISLWLSVLAPWCPPYAHSRKAVAVDSAATAGGSGVSAMAGGGTAGGACAAGGLRHHNQQDGVGALGSAAAAAAGMMEATAAKLHLGGGNGVKDRDRDLAGATSREVISQYKYTSAWRGHVLAHLPFYLLLLPQFASLSLSRLKYRPDVALRDLDRVLAVLAAAGPELLLELRTAEAALNDFLRPAAAGGRRRSEGELGEMVPWWLEQASGGVAQDFEMAAAAGSSPPGAVQPDVTGRLFTIDSAGAAYTACLLLRSAETLGRPELVAALRQSASAVLPLDSILPAAAEAEQGGRQGEGAAEGALDARRFPRAGRWSSHLTALVQQDPRLADPRRLWAHMYRGHDGRHDPLYRPIASNEAPWLVRPLVLASTRINVALGLDAPYRPGEEELDPPEHLGQLALLWARKRGYRVNLRIFAEVQTLVWLMVLWLLVYSAWRMLGGSGSGAGGGDVIQGSPYGRAQADAYAYQQDSSGNLYVSSEGVGSLHSHYHGAYHQAHEDHSYPADSGEMPEGGYRFRT
ncbi:hypothetical protein VOLCADRAFT_127384 [Volvox carteri f. nagariensis]|uniref:Sphingomyelin phosphodiesterase 4 n=1 Tax=Volvox carteri f. nagariensis TaxID=3068 RepID=D8THQ7_VOLCA|nr:uncharacterized protein VOLCADRAFT_127384 [Volvox carteri f. nagariensis]EFJ53110.1 hypothetical protein VOLCADRAFT_127384 [Volvox carteri f. nagariensis]|eukprot:XP_002946115.1 hypothetical protein VOLCADRAFT_127384 [Volvox carteri f. nagariensis]